MGRLDNRVAWVTGGGRGIGRAIALAFAAEGAAVAVSARSGPELDAVAEEIRACGGRSLAVTADAMSLDDTSGAAEAVAAGLGAVDILVNNAGGGTGLADADHLTPAQRDAALFAANVDLNLFSAYRASGATPQQVAAAADGHKLDPTATQNRGHAN